MYCLFCDICFSKNKNLKLKAKLTPFCFHLVKTKHYFIGNFYLLTH